MGTALPPGHAEIDRGRRQPLYAQIKSLLVTELDGSALGERRIFSDSVLMRRFGVSRMTVRNAVAELVREGVVERIPGRGTFLRQRPAMAVHLDGLERFLQEWRLPHLHTKILAFRHVPTPSDVTARLQLAPKTRTLMIRRLREDENGAPIVLDVRHVAPWCEAGITRVDAERQSLFVTIAETSGIDAVRVVQRIWAEDANQQTADILQIEPGKAILRREVTFFSADERPLLTGESLYRSDRFTFEVTASR